MPDVVVVGGGVIGLTAAFELSSRGASVAILDQSDLGREASWAGAGMLPPAQIVGDQFFQELQLQSHSLWPQLTERLHNLSGIDNGYRNCGSLQIQINESQDLSKEVREYRNQDVLVEELVGSEVIHLESQLSDSITSAYRLPTMCQVRNPRHLSALKVACVKQGVTFHPGEAVVDWEVENDRIQWATTRGQRFSADRFLVTAGAWTSQLLAPFDIDLQVEPVRGQIVLLKVDELPFTHIIECGPRYLVPRGDGRILIGSTEEHVGFRKENTAAGIEGLLAFATQAVPCLKDARIENTWSGLRPFSQSGPYLGPVPDISNMFVAAGHFRDGLSQSPATGQRLAEMILTD